MMTRMAKSITRKMKASWRMPIVSATRTKTIAISTRTTASSRKMPVGGGKHIGFREISLRSIQLSMFLVEESWLNLLGCLISRSVRRTATAEVSSRKSDDRGGNALCFQN